MARLHFSALSDRGIRSINNDAFCAEKIGNYHVFGVAEGQPDPAHEEDASDIAVSSLRESVKNQKNSPAAALAAAVHESDTRISEHAANSPDGKRDMTHLSACLIDDSLKCTILDTGEGNAYLIGSDGIHVPGEHPLSGQPEGLGFLEGGHSGDKRRGDMISHTLGEPHILTKADFAKITIIDRFLLLSSGGLHDYVKKNRIAEIVLQNGENVEASCEFLLEEALSAGSDRTITLVLVHGHYH
ncbi:MAG: PP2C family serine/threonine-protein phosphatase [Methanoregula sp.]|jgi:serine/threonine protein phosphatase PrpC